MFKKSVLRRAWVETKRRAGGWFPIACSVTGSVLGLAALYGLRGRAAMMEELFITVVCGVVPAAAIFLGIFLYNWARAPYLIEKDRREAAERALALRVEAESVRRLVEARQEFTIAEAACLLTGTPVTRGEVEGAAAICANDIAEKMFRGEVEPADPDDSMVNIAITVGRFSKDGGHIGSKVKISKSTLAQLAQEYAVDIPGLTADAALSPASPPDTGGETQP